MISTLTTLFDFYAKLYFFASKDDDMYFSIANSSNTSLNASLDDMFNSNFSLGSQFAKELEKDFNNCNI